MTQSGKGRDGGTGPRIAGTIEGDMQPCWLCGRSVAGRALFCHACGAVQPPREGLDHFTRLGLECRFDIELEALNRQFTGLGRALDPDRFVARGKRQQEHARAQADALAEAYEMLRDPVRRARYLLDLSGAGPLENDPGEPADVTALRGELAAATDALTVDRLALDVEQRAEACIRELAMAFRAGLTATARRVVARLEELEDIAAEARTRRAALGPTP
ncbi:molecular chaperone DnaJ [Azospirillum sp.]|uniref:molecular chaperone DnaJ n=1 Tax=Azospirillum sp. TaxID=34012 RepID=UPI002D289D6B|nr:molecular chaperone DnaJ [Azospirillum sp.]HYD64329.1 molecular chaperone DnaJ [Azospirillum sp.]